MSIEEKQNLIDKIVFMSQFVDWMERLEVKRLLEENPDLQKRGANGGCPPDRCDDDSDCPKGQICELLEIKGSECRIRMCVYPKRSWWDRWGKCITGILGSAIYGAGIGGLSGAGTAC